MDERVEENVAVRAVRPNARASVTKELPRAKYSSIVVVAALLQESDVPTEEYEQHTDDECHRKMSHRAVHRRQPL